MPPLDSVAPFDWAALLRERVDGHGPGAPLEGLARGGWKLVYTEEPTVFSKTLDSARDSESFLYSLGVAVGKEDKVVEVFWDSPAFAAGVAPGMTLVAVNGRAYTAPVLREAIKAAHVDQRQEIDLLLRNDDVYRTVSLDYHGGLRYPRLERIEGTDDRLSAILRSRTDPRR